MLSTQLRILRVFGLSSAEVASVLRTARAEGCPGLRLLERDGEFAVCIQVSAPTRAMAEDYCEKWTQKLRARFGDAVYGTGEISLAQATLDALVKKRRLIVAADEPTGRLVGALLRPLEHSEAVFDYGTQTYANPENARKIVTPQNLLQKFPGDVLQAAAGRAQLALTVGNADYAAVYMPATVGQAPFVLLCDKRSAVACAVSPELSDAAIANNILDLARRRALGLKFSASTISFRPGHERPLLIVSQEGQTKGDTTRFSLRRRTPKTADSSFEPMMDFDTVLPQQEAQPAPTRRVVRTASRNSGDTAPLGTITFENAATAAPREQEQTPLPDPMEITTAGPEAAAASRAARGVTVPESEAPTSILDGEIPDFSAGLDPEAIAAAQAADDAQPPKSAEEFQRAASRLFADEDDEEEDPPEKKRRTAPRTKAAPTIKNRSLAMIEKTERRRRRATILGLLFFVLLLAGIAVGVYLFLRGDLGSEPSARTYGTAAYDESVTDYLNNAWNKLDGVGGYLGFPGRDGFLVYAQDAEVQEEEPAARLPQTSYLGSSQPSNTVLDCGGNRLAALADLETFRQNSGFTLYLNGATYRYKVVAVYYADPADAANPFDPAACTDLSNYYDYLNFVLETQIRSLYTTGVEVGTDASFLTLVSEGDTPGTRLWVTGRLIAEGEDAQLDTSAIQAAQTPLLTAAQYQGQEMPDAAALRTAALEAFNAQPTDTAPDQEAPAEETAAQEPTFDVDALAAEAHALAQSTSELLAGLTDVAGSANAVETEITQGAEGELPEQNVTLETVTATATPAPTETPTAAPTAAPESQASTPTPQEESNNGLDVDGAGDSGSGSASSGETINVTMNGTAQTMDLVQCLAMIAQNELGDGAPAEAYKAQCVAAHCWILSQGGYPSVAGTSPSAAATAAAQEVAHVLITYNGSVCFTPYFASASTGTASAADVWGSDRPWLQAVDSPYDQTVATNWNTNGNNTGCARFSRQTLQDRILSELGIDLSGVDPNNWFKILSANQYGWVAQMQIGPDEGPNTTCSGRWFRENLTAGQSVDGRSLRSQCFTFTYDASLDCFIFDVYGYGHGCGMSQWGAVGYAQNGWDYASILTHYFPGTTLTTY